MSGTIRTFLLLAALTAIFMAVGGAIGAFIFGMANKGIVYAQWNPDWFKFFLGLMLLLATIVNLIVKRRADASK